MWWGSKARQRHSEKKKNFELGRLTRDDCHSMAGFPNHLCHQDMATVMVARRDSASHKAECGSSCVCPWEAVKVSLDLDIPRASSSLCLLTVQNLTRNPHFVPSPASSALKQVYSIEWPVQNRGRCEIHLDICGLT